MMAKAKRESNIELMRIICILMVIGGHYYTHGFPNINVTGVNEVFLKIFGGFSKFAVNCFVIITGYFGKNLSTKRIVPVIKDRWFYSIFLSFILVVLGFREISVKFSIITMFPLITCRHNYITVFVMLYFFIPYINEWFEKITKQQIIKFLLTEGIFVSVIPTIFNDFSRNTYAYLFWMIFLYQIGYYLGYYKPNIPWKICFPISMVILLSCSLIVEPLINRLLHKNTNLYFANTQYSIVLLLASICMVGFFSSVKIKYSPVINWFSKSTFAVYILHDDPDIRAIIWSKVFRNEFFADKNILPIHFFVSIFSIYNVCVLIDKIYCLLFSKPLWLLFERAILMFDNLKKCILNKFRHYNEV